MRKSIFARMLAFLLGFLLLAGIAPTVAAEETYSDISGHWAKAAIERWSSRGVLLGSNGKFRPNDTVTRAELSVILNRLLKYPTGDYPIFLDLTGDEWFYDDMTALARQGILENSVSIAKGYVQLDRAEAIRMIALSFGIDITMDFDGPGAFTDVKGLYRYAVAMRNYGFIDGFPDGSFQPARNITRAEVVTILDNMITGWIDKPGVYEEPLGKGVLVSAPNVTLKNQDLAYLFVAPGVGSGSVTVSGGDVSGSVQFVVAPDKTALIIEPGSSGEGRMAFTKLEPHFDTRFARGTGVSGNPYIIETQAQLELLQGRVKYPNWHIYDSYSIPHVALGNDITLTGLWLPMSGSYFFYGRGHTIRGLNVYLSDTDPDASIPFPYNNAVNAGLFGYLRGGAFDLNVEGVIRVELSRGSSVKAGGVAGCMDYLGSSTIRHDSLGYNAKVDISVEGARTVAAGCVFGENNIIAIVGSSASGDIVITANPISGSDVDAGLFVGYGNYSSIINSKSSGSVRITSGSSSGTVHAGGLAGKVSSSNLTNCLSSATVYAEGGTVSAGGIAGAGKSATNCTSSGDVTAISHARSYDAAYGNVRDDAIAGGVIGQAMDTKISGCSASGKIAARGGRYTNAGGVVGLLERAGTTSPTIFSRMENSYATGAVTAADSLLQCNAGGAAGYMHNSFADNCWASGNVSASGDPVYFNAVGGFAGSIYENTEVNNCFASGSVSSRVGYASIGGFVGRFGGKVANCYATGEVIDYEAPPGVEEGLVGSIRSGSESMRQCADLIKTSRSFPMFVDAPDVSRPAFVSLTLQQISQEATYASRGWDFKEIWKMPASGSYRLPILRGVGESEQMAQPMPAHLK